MSTCIVAVEQKLKSIRFLDGQFFDLRWHSIFVPLTPAESRAFRDKVGAAEARLNRVLSFVELSALSQEVMNAVPAE